MSKKDLIKISSMIIHLENEEKDSMSIEIDENGEVYISSDNWKINDPSQLERIINKIQAISKEHI